MTTECENVPSLEEKLTEIRKYSSENVVELVSRLDLLSRLPTNYLNSLDDKDRVLCFRATLLCYCVTNGVQIPREMQLRAVLADQHENDYLVAAGTGSGKTLPMALNILLEDATKNWITLTISPLKRLQSTQETDFNTRYGIPTVVINEDTPRDDAWWNKHVYNSKKHLPGRARHLIVTVEQLFKSREGHFPRLYVLIRNQGFQNLISRLNVDEVHHIYTAGLPHHGLDAFRPAWGRLDELRAILPHRVKVGAYSATVTAPHILRTVELKLLRPTYVFIHLTSNRPNTMYATHEVKKSIDELTNYDCFLLKPFNLEAQPRVLIFVDNKDLACRISNYLDSRLPEELRMKNIVMHYHSQMSEEYLKFAHKCFTQINGPCRIMVATSSQSVGIDFPNVEIVCTVGLPTTTVETLQRGGRASRNSDKKALFVMFYEPWVNEVDLDSYNNGDILDPDRPRMKLKPNSQRQERAPFSSMMLVRSKRCIRRHFAGYLADKSPEALLYTTEYCCDSVEDHPDACSFNLQDFLPGCLPGNETPADLNIVDTEMAAEKSNPKYRPPKERPALDFRLIEWLKVEHELDPLRSVRPPHLILSHTQRFILTRVNANQIKLPSDITALLNESSDWADEWALKLFNVFLQYKADLLTLNSAKGNKRKRN